MNRPTMPAPRRVRSDENEAHLEPLRASLDAAIRADVREVAIVASGGVAGAFCFLVVLPVVLVIAGA